MRHTFAFLFTLLAGSVLAQKAVYIEYDYIHPTNTRIGYIGINNDTVFQGKKFVKIKGATPCVIRLMNYNQEALQAKGVLHKGTNLDSVSSANFSSFFSTTLGLIAPSVGINFSNILPKSRGQAKVRNAIPVDMAPLYPNFELLAPPTENQENALVKYDTLIRGKLSDIGRWKMLLNRLNQLRYNTSFEAAETKQRCVLLLGTLTSDAAVALKDEVKAQKAVQLLARENAEYLRFALLSFEKEVANAPRGAAEVVDEYELAKENIKEYQKYINSNTEEDLRQVMEQIRVGYQSILNNPFESHLTMIIDERTDILQLNTYRLSNENQKNAGKMVQSQPFFVKTSGNVAILNSVGIGLIRFKEPIETYFVNASKIVGTPSDQVLPSISFYLHFVSRGQGALKLGGHFGVGIPLSESKSINFQFGPTLTIGRQNGICLNFGMVAGRVSRLGGGLRVGDIYTAATTLPIVTRYEWGYQIGLSFNVATLLKR